MTFPSSFCRSKFHKFSGILYCWEKLKNRGIISWEYLRLQARLRSDLLRTPPPPKKEKYVTRAKPCESPKWNIPLGTEIACAVGSLKLFLFYTSGKLILPSSLAFEVETDKAFELETEFL